MESKITGNIKISVVDKWRDYELIDSGEGRRLERFGKYILDRPDPQIIWKMSLPQTEWNKADAKFERSKNDKGEWVLNKEMPSKWPIKINDLEYWVKLTPFKHTGIFPEQYLQWEFISNKIKSFGEKVNILNLFAYTGVTTIVCAKAGAKVTHLDASKPAVTWANENRELNKMGDAPIRWIIDEALSFTEREIKRGVRYDAIIMDPPAYGHGPKGEPWDFNKDFPRLIENCRKILSPTPLFVLVNAYAISSSSVTLANTIRDYFSDSEGVIDSGELGIRESSEGRILSTGIWAKWEAD